MDEKYTGSRISQARKEKGWTQKELAERLHISTAAISKWERGLNFPDLSLLQPLARELDVSAAELLGLENETAETAVQAITQISTFDHQQKNRILKISTIFIAFTALIVFCMILNSYSKNAMYLAIIEFIQKYAILYYIFFICVISAWAFGVGAIISERKSFNFISISSCAIGIYIIILNLLLSSRIDLFITDDITIDLKIDHLFALISITGTILLNAGSVFINKCSHRKEKRMSPKVSINRIKQNHDGKIEKEIKFRKTTNILFLMHIIVTSFVLLSLMQFPLYGQIGMIAFAISFSSSEKELTNGLIILICYFVIICAIHILSHLIFYKPKHSKIIKILITITIAIDIILMITCAFLNVNTLDMTINAVYDVVYIILAFNMIPFWAKKEDIERWKQAKTKKATKKAALSDATEVTAPQEDL